MYKKAVVRLLSGIFLITTGMVYSEEPIIEPVDPAPLFGMNLEDFMKVKVITASKSLESIDDAPNVMYVITADQIKKRGYKNLKDALRHIPGMTVVFSTNIDSPVVRGIKSLESLVVMVNGHIINNMTESNMLNGPVNLTNVERIEVIVGPGAVLYPPETCTAIVNLITKKEFEEQEVIISAGTGGYLSGSFNAGSRSFDSDLFVSATWMKQDGIAGYLPTSETRSKVAKHDVVDQIYPSNQILATATHMDWSIQFFHLDQDMPYIMAYNSDQVRDAHRYDYLDSILVKRKHDWTEKIKSSISLGFDNKRYVRVYETTNNNANNENFDLSQRVYKLEAEVQAQLGKHFLQAGLLYQLRQNRHNYMFGWNVEDPDPYISGFMNQMVDLEDTSSFGIYLSEKYTLNDQWSFVGAVRFDQDELLKDNNKIITSPRAAAIYKPTDSQTLKLMYNKATRMPSPWYSMQNALWGKNNVVATNLGSWARLNTRAEDPEELTAYEIQSISYIKEARLSLVGYYQELKNFMDWNNPFTNIGDYSGYGLEGQIYAPLKEHAWWLNMSVNKTKLDVTSNTDPSLNGSLHSNSSGEILGSPQFIATSGFEYNYDALTIVPMIRYEAQNPYAYIEGATIIEGYRRHNFYADLSITLSDLWNHFSLNVTVQNIFNNTDYLGVIGNAVVSRPRGTWFLISTRVTF